MKLGADILDCYSFKTNGKREEIDKLILPPDRAVSHVMMIPLQGDQELFKTQFRVTKEERSRLPYEEGIKL